MKRTRLAIVGFGALGQACAQLAATEASVQVAGFVRRTSHAAPRPRPFDRMPAVAHVSELGRVDVALVCVPAKDLGAVAHDLLQREVPVVECAELHGAEFDAHAEAMRRIAAHHRVHAIVGAGWDPGALSLMRALFAASIPKGGTEVYDNAYLHAHHTTLEQSIPGVRRALATELRTSDGRVQRYVYFEPEAGADPKAVEARIREDSAAPASETLVFPLDASSAQHEAVRALVLRRHGTVSGTHQFMLLEARIDAVKLAAQMMLTAALALPSLERRCYTIFELPLSAFSGAAPLAAWRQRWV